MERQLFRDWSFLLHAGLVEKSYVTNVFQQFVVSCEINGD